MVWAAGVFGGAWCCRAQSTVEVVPTGLQCSVHVGQFRAVLSGDGRTVALTVADAGVGADRAAQWTIDRAPGEAVVLPTDGLGVQPHFATYSDGINADGTVIVGSVRGCAGVACYARAVRWRRDVAGVWTSEAIGGPPGYEYATATDVSADGMTVVGGAWRTGEGGQLEAAGFVWTPSGGVTLLPPGAAGDSSWWVTAVSANGQVAVGWSGNAAVRWTIGGGVEILPPTTAPAGVTVFGNVAYAVSADGRAVAGQMPGSAGSNIRDTPWRWTAEDGTERLLTVGATGAAIVDGHVRAISDDGERVLGRGGAASLFDGLYRAAETGTVPLAAAVEYATGIDVHAYSASPHADLDASGRTLLLTDRRTLQGVVREELVIVRMPEVLDLSARVRLASSYRTYELRCGQPLVLRAQMESFLAPLDAGWWFEPAGGGLFEGPDDLELFVTPPESGRWWYGAMHAGGMVRTESVTVRSCLGDYNVDGAVTVGDVFDFLRAYFAGEPETIFDCGEPAGVQRLFDVLATYFGGC